MMQIRRILAASSLQAPSPKAALTAAEVAAVAHAELVVLTVLDNPWELVRADEVEGLRRTHVGSPAELAATRARTQLAELVGPAVLAAPSISYRAAFGWPSVEIVRCAEEIEADVIVLGRSEEAAHAPGERVTPATLRRSRVPVLVAPPVHKVYRRVLACVDDSPSALVVLEAAQTMADCFGAGVAALHVEPSSASVAARGDRRPWLRHLEQVAEARGAGATGVCAFETLVRQGDVTTEILAEVAADRAELVVFGYHRGMNYGGAGSVITVAARLLRRAPCALLAVPV
jgi:nucleotide-binding universal stress UspA family protein